MEKRIINPWQWQDKFGYAQAVEVRQAESTLFVSGQTAIDAEGRSSTADMETQLRLAIQNLEHVIGEAGYECTNVVRLNIYTTSFAELLACFGIYTDWVSKHGMKLALTVLEVNSLFETLKVELEATLTK